MKDPRPQIYRLAAFLCPVAAALSLAALLSIPEVSTIPGIFQLDSRARFIAFFSHQWWPPLVLTWLAAMASLIIAPSLALLLAEKSPFLALLAGLHGLAGAAIQTVTQFMQTGATHRAAIGMVLHKGEITKSAHLAQSSAWNIMYPFSNAYGLALLGQTFLCLMLLMAAIAWIGETGTRRAVAVISLLIAPLQAAALIGYWTGWKNLDLGAAAADLSIIAVFILLTFVFNDRYKQLQKEKTEDQR